MVSDRHNARRGFTLLEVLIAATIGAIVLSAVLGAFVMVGRSGQLIYFYNGISADSRRWLDEFGRDARMASDLTWNSATSVTLTVPDNYASHGNQVTYAYDSGSSGYTAKSFYRKPGNAASNGLPTVLARNCAAVTFHRFAADGSSAVTDAATRRLEAVVKLRVGGTVTAAATETLISAPFLLRNKGAQ